MLTHVAGPLAVAEPVDACSPLSVSLDDAFVLVDRGTCSFVEKALHVQEAGARGIIVSNIVEGEAAFAMGYDQHEQAVTIMAMMVTREAGLELQLAVAQIEADCQHAHIHVQLQASSAHVANTQAVTMEQHVYVPDATQKWLQKHSSLYDPAAQQETSRTWQSVMASLATSMQTQPIASTDLDRLVHGRDRSQQYQVPD